MKTKSRAKTARGANALFDYEFYYIYNKLKKKKLKKELRINNRAEFLSFCRRFFRIVSEEIQEREAGVVIKGLGYFYNYLVPRKMPMYHTNDALGVKQSIMYHTDGHIYTLCYIPSDNFKYWSMDNSFSKEMKRGLYYRLMKGQRYNGYPFSTKRLR